MGFRVRFEPGKVQRSGALAVRAQVWCAGLVDPEGAQYSVSNIAFRLSLSYSVHDQKLTVKP